MTKPSAPFGIGTSARRRERADLAELHEGLGAHVAVDAACDRQRQNCSAPVLRPRPLIAAIAEAQAASQIKFGTVEVVDIARCVRQCSWPIRRAYCLL